MYVCIQCKNVISSFWLCRESKTLCKPGLVHPPKAYSNPACLYRFVFFFASSSVGSFNINRRNEPRPGDTARSHLSYVGKGGDLGPTLDHPPTRHPAPPARCALTFENPLLCSQLHTYHNLYSRVCPL